MADEQIIYLSPDEELTNVRERLERVQARRIILVIPTQTQLRSHVGWRLLHSRARELGKEVLVISADRQIRSVVKAAGFKVADSLESTPVGKTRLGSRPGRTGLGGKTSPHLRTPAKGLPTGKVPTGLRAGSPGKPASGTPKGTPTSQPDPQTSLRGAATEQHYEYRIDTAPPIRPIVSQHEDEEADHWAEDVEVAQRIRQSAQESGAGLGASELKELPLSAPMPPEDVIPEYPPGGTPGAIQSMPDLPQPYSTTPDPNEMEDPFSHMDDFQSVPLSEQHGSVSINELDEGEGSVLSSATQWSRHSGGEGVPDIADYPTEGAINRAPTMGDIEDLGDEGDFVERQDVPPRSWADMLSGEDVEMSGSERVHGVRPRNSRIGKPPLSDVDLEDDLPPISERPTLIMPPGSSARPSGALPPTAGTRTSQPLTPATTQPRLVPASTPSPLRKQGKRPSSSRTVTGSQGRDKSGPYKTTPQRKVRTNPVIPLLVSIIILVLLGTLVYFGPSADVTITLPSQSFSTPVTLTATAHSQQDVRLHTVPAQNLSFDTSAQGTGRATGSTKIGTVQATGNVVFTNNGPLQVDIPTGTMVSTDSGVQFATTADAVVLTKGSNIGNTAQVPVQAVLPGESGNVPIISITVIPPESQVKIEQASHLASVSVTVTNPTATTGGGAGNATTVTSNDINTEKAVLDKQIQAAVSVWLAQQVHSGDVRGKVVQVETPLATPAQGQIAQGGTFSETLKLHLTVLVVRAADLQVAASAQLNDAAKIKHTGFALVPQQQVHWGPITNKPSSDGTALTLSFAATGQIGPAISEQEVRDWLSGKSIVDAHTYLKGIPNILDSTITVYPSFFPWVAFWQPQIHVHFKSVPKK